ncbi:MAG: tRNA uridine-5-carboxymethylaminomethyl(34) synthesis GTPase MnmE [Candidatus Angelobacter sp. Gp1-AA117]|nr:MAG: tRNA uridine-5-carboxymethylaminomethyl(34) synthesis GTPase MnmE [Candidatus Angelobacter sp. Gp1-AA117]
MNLDDTIVAIATPPGRGGIGVVRLSGPEAGKIAGSMLRLKHDLEPGRALFSELIDETGERIDEAVVTYFAKPHSYTTDDVVEISAHGSPVVLRHVIEIALAKGARLAEPGEFTMRAFLNGRLDLTQAEAVRDLIESQTLFQAKVAAQQLEGALSRRLQPIKKKLVNLIAVMEAGIDFAEDDVAVLPAEQILEHISEVEQPLEKLLASFAYGKVVHEGFTLAIVGRPNVGKSSLFNCLVERERAIVTATPGTTRDLVTETVALNGIPVKLIDTAGIRHSTDEAESIGIRKSYEALSEADMVLVVLDSSQGISEEDRELFEAAHHRRALVAANKTDLAKAPLSPPNELKMLRTSAVTGEGIDQLRTEILSAVSGASAGEQETGFLTNIRHQRLVQESLMSLAAAREAVTGRIPHEMIMIDLYSALRPLDAITGETTADDILNLIFSSFCIGK